MTLAELATWIGRIQMAGAAIRGLRAAGQRGVSEIITFIIPSRTPQPVDRSIFRGGWRSVPMEYGCTIENLEPHAVFIEDGVRNIRISRAMIDALAEWAIRKGIATEADARSAAWGIAKNMEKRGHIFGENGMGILRELCREKLIGFIDEEVRREIDREISRT